MVDIFIKTAGVDAVPAKVVSLAVTMATRVAVGFAVFGAPLTQFRWAEEFHIFATTVATKRLEAISF